MILLGLVYPGVVRILFSRVVPRTILSSITTMVSTPERITFVGGVIDIRNHHIPVGVIGNESSEFDIFTHQFFYSRTEIQQVLQVLQVWLSFNKNLASFGTQVILKVLRSFHNKQFPQYWGI